MSRHTTQIHVIYVIIILKKTGKSGKFMIYIYWYKNFKLCK